MIYFDNASTTKTDEEILDLFIKIEKEYYGNIDSTHEYSFLCQKIYLDTKKKITKLLNLQNQDLIFTQSASMANNLAIKGYLENKKGHVIVSSIEHKSVLEVFKNLHNLEITYVKPENGIITKDLITEHLRTDTIFVSVQFVNNETGAINEVEQIALYLKNKNIIFHVDACQAVQKLKINFKDFDLMTISLHKIHGLKNSGMLIKKNEIHLKPLIYGGLQESGLISGTISLATVCAAYLALKKALEVDLNHVKNLKKIFLENYQYGVNEVANSVDYIINCYIIGVFSQTTTNILGQNKIYISAQSACYKNKYSYVLEEMNLEKEILESSFRISFSKYNTEEEVLYLCEKLNEIGEKYGKSHIS